MKFDYLSSYDRSFKKLSKDKQAKVTRTIDTFIDFFKTGKKSEGLGLRKLRGKYWEIRIDVDYRILFKLEKDVVTFILVGDHNIIKRFLKR